MTQQTYRYMPEIKDDKCYRCQFSQFGVGVFDVCTAGDSKYRADGKQEEFHTMTHMRTVGSCGEAARLFIVDKAKEAAYRQMLADRVVDLPDAAKAVL